jgi:hypothetical protein
MINESDVKVVRFISGQELIAEVVKQLDGSMVLKNPLVLQVGFEGQDLKAGMFPFAPLAKTEDFPFTKEFVDQNILTVYTPVDDLIERYRQAHSDIVLPQSKLQLS